MFIHAFVVYLESFARCATQMMRIMDGKQKGPGLAQENEQISLFQFGLEMKR